MIVEILTVILIVVTLLMIGSVLLQKPEGNSFGSTATESLSNILSANASRNPMARITGWLAGAFFALCLSITFMTKTSRSHDALDKMVIESKPQAAESQADSANTRAAASAEDAASSVPSTPKQPTPPVTPNKPTKQ